MTEIQTTETEAASEKVVQDPDRKNVRPTGERWRALMQNWEAMHGDWEMTPGKSCGRTQPDTLGHQHCWLPKGHWTDHKSQSDEWWVNDQSTRDGESK